MHRIIDGTLFERQSTPSGYLLSHRDLGHGHHEVALVPSYTWSEVGEVEPGALADAQRAATCDFIDGEWVPRQRTQEMVMRARDAAAQRARSNVRRRCKHLQLCELVTLTYRENMVDRDRLMRDFDVFMKRLRRLVPDLHYVAVAERQKRGAWHMHIAVPRVLSHYAYRGHLVRSYDLLRSLWRGIVGADNGNIDVARRRRVRGSLRRLAGYLSKYIGKAFADDTRPAHIKAFTASRGKLPQATLVRLDVADLSEAMSMVLALLGPEFQAGKLHQAMVGRGIYWAAIDLPS
jgi:hypothetical protein